MQMEASEHIILKELNKKNDEVFKLYCAGKYYKAASKAFDLFYFAKERLGNTHPSLALFHDNYQYVNGKGLEQKSFTRLSPKNQIHDVMSQLHEKLLLLYAANRHLEASRETQNILRALSQQLKPNHPYMDLLSYRLDAMESYGRGSRGQEKKWSEIPKPKSSLPVQKRFIALSLSLGALAQLLLMLIFFRDSLPVPWGSSTIYYEGEGMVQEDSVTPVYNYELRAQAIIDVPLILQYPELPRGCEVTSLAMLLEHAGVPVDKMTLAKEVKKDATPFRRENGRVYFGNPYDGFVGDMYSLERPGLGVYHGPIRELLEAYLPQQVVDFTGMEFNTLFYFLSQEIPVWVITNTRHRKLSSDQFQTWHTPSGPIQITYRQHAVLVTGYDEKYIYFNDPLIPQGNQRVSRESFEAAWRQMGKQAISYIPIGKTLEEILPIEVQKIIP